MGEFIEFTGKTTEEALERAQEHWQLPLNRLEVEVVSTGSSGIFGLLAKKARVRVRPLPGSSREEDMAALAAMVSEGHKPSASKPAATKPAPAAPAAKPAPPAPRPVAPVSAARPEPPAPALAPAPTPAPTPAASAATPTVSAAPAAPSAPPAQAAEPVVAAPVEPSVAAAAPARPAPPAPPPEPLAQDLGETNAEDEPEEDEAEGEGEADQRLEQEPEVVEHSRQVLARMVTPLEESAQVRAQGGLHGIELVIDSQDVGVLIGRRGQNLEALQYLVTRIVSHRYGRPVRILVDAGDYRRRRNEALEELALRMAQKSRQSGRPVAIGPLSAQERRVVHLVLKKEDGLVTNSRGRGELKKVVISPKA